MSTINTVLDPFCASFVWKISVLIFFVRTAANTSIFCLKNSPSSIFTSLIFMQFRASLRKSRVCWPTGRALISLVMESWSSKERFAYSEPKMNERSSSLTSCCSLPRSEKKPIHTRLTYWSVVLLWLSQREIKYTLACAEWRQSNFFVYFAVLQPNVGGSYS